MEEFWNDRYKNDQFAYGEEPNHFFKQTINKLKFTGNLLLPAEGEGRNAVYAAKKNIKVTAYDLSIEGKLKANKLAKKNNVLIDYKVGDLNQHSFKKESFDAIGLIYAHFSKNKQEIHKQLIELLKPNGYFILEGFSVDNISYKEKNPKVGGPSNIDMLYSIEEIKSTFKNFKIIQLEQVETELSEGEYHNGIASVIRFIGKKNA
jgi:SAM-dependent methyltransferase